MFSIISELDIKQVRIKGTLFPKQIKVSCGAGIIKELEGRSEMSHGNGWYNQNAFSYLFISKIGL